MALITLQEVKTQLGLDDTLDVMLGYLIPLVSYQVVYAKTQNRFVNQKITMTSSTLTFDEDAGTIVDSQAQFIESDFFTGKQDIVIGGSLYNDGLYELASVSTTTMTLDLSTMTEGFKDEAEEQFVEIKQVVFPQALKLTTGKWLGYLINTDNYKGIKSENVLSYSVSYVNDMPPDIKAEFAEHKKLKFC